MLAEVSWENEMIIFTFTPNEEDAKRPKAFNEVKKVFFKQIETNEFPSVHPDRLALVAILLTLPFIENELIINWKISSKFEDACAVISRIKILPLEGHSQPCPELNEGLPSLSFSGGADSTAALAVMPKQTIPCFMLRTKASSRSLYRSESAEKSCSMLNNIGYNVQIIESNLEYIRDPVGFPTDLSVASPIILLSEHLNIRSIAFGTILESAYGTGGKMFRDYTSTAHFGLWNTLFDGAGIKYSLPVAGVSEVGTELILQKTGFNNFSQSCIRGEWKTPCDNCWKCFRKNLLIQSLNGDTSDKKLLNMLNHSKEVRLKLLSDIPIKHECILTYSLSIIQINSIEINALSALVRVGEFDISWMEKWYGESISLIDSEYQSYSKSKLCEILGIMGETEKATLHDWQNNPNQKREANLTKLRNLIS